MKKVIDKKRSVGPFIKNGHDLFVESSGLWWFTTIFLFLIFIGSLVYVALFINSFSFEHTYFKNPGQPGILSSQRYSFLWVITMLTVVAHFALLYVVFLFVRFRANFGCNVVMFILYILIFAFVAYAVAVFGVEYNDCNKPDQRNNMCNAKEWCCINYSNPLNECPNSTPCTDGTTQNTLEPLFEFSGIIWSNVALASLYFIFILVMVIYWFSSPDAFDDVEDYEQAYYSEYEHEDEVQQTSSAIYQSKKTHASNFLSNQHHSLRKRK